MTDAEWSRLNRRVHRDAFRTRQKKYDHAHRAERTAYMQQWRAKNREADNAYHREYHRTHKNSRPQRSNAESGTEEKI